MPLSQQSKLSHECQKIPYMMGDEQQQQEQLLYSKRSPSNQNASGNLVSQQHNAQQIFGYPSPSFAVPKIESNLMNPIFYNSKLPPLRVDYGEDNQQQQQLQQLQLQQQPQQGIPHGFHNLNNRPLPTLFNSIGRPFVQSENDDGSKFNYSELIKFQQFPVLESILNQSLNFVDCKGSDQDYEQSHNKKKYSRLSDQQQEYGGGDQNYFQSNGNYNQILDGNHRNMMMTFGNRELFNQDSPPPQYSNQIMLNDQQPFQPTNSNNPKRKTTPPSNPTIQQNNGYFRLQNFQNTNVVVYKIELIYSESSRRYRQPFSIVGSKDMTFYSFINKFRELANFSSSSDFNLFVEKEQDLVPLISMDQLAQTKANFIRIMESKNSSPQNQSQSSLTFRKSSSSKKVLAKKINKKKKIKESIAITKLTNAQEEAAKRKQKKFF